MKKNSVINKIENIYKNAYYLPADTALKTAERNTEVLIKALSVLLFFGLSGMLSLSIGGRAAAIVSDCSDEVPVRHMMHFYIGFSLIMLAAVKFIVQKKKCLALHETAHYISLSFMFFICIYTCMNSYQPVNGFLILVCITILVLLGFHISPLVFILAQTTAVIIMTPVLHSHYSGAITGNIWIFTFLNYPLVFSRHFSYIKRIKASENLKAENSKLNSELAERNETTIRNLNCVIRGMASVIETRDDDTGHHIQRTSEYCRMIAEAAREKEIYTDQIDDLFITMLEKAAPMHDVGKIAIPDNILKKPDSLTASEFELIKTHTTEGDKMISHIFGELEIANQDFIEMVHNMVLFHHERWNGQGYPNGISGEKIPLCARIMSLADVYDALISKRCYKEEFSKERALSEITEGAGEQFDPVLAEVFLEIMGGSGRKDTQC